MNLLDNITFFLFAFLAGHSLFLTLVLIFGGRRRNTKLLGLLLLLLLIRVGKSVIALAIPESAFVVSIIGLVGMAAMGPVLWSYTRGLFLSSKLNAPGHFLHLIPSFLTIFIPSWKWLNLTYYLVTAHLLFYLIFLCIFLLKNREALRIDNIHWKWATVLLACFSLIWTTFVLQLFAYDRLLYVIIVIVSLVLTYGLSLWAFTQQKLFTSQKPKKELESEDYEQIRLQIEQLMREEIFTDTSLNLTALAKRLNKQPYVVSRVINDKFNRTFPELLLQYRIRKAEELLLSSLNKTYTVEGIAYESGFSTLSAFYVAFKKETGMTPTQFKKGNEGKNMRVA
jgi:AraC-like DNA-binding protein